MAAPEARPAEFDRAAQHRRGLLGKIHVGKRQLAISDDDFQQILFDERIPRDQSGKARLSEATEGQLEQVVARLKRIGFKPVPTFRGSRAGNGKPRPAASHPMARKARALWISLYHLGVVNTPTEQALEAFAERQLGCERLVWAKQSDGFRLIEALKNMAARNGWAQSGPSGSNLNVEKLQEGLCEAILAKLQAKAMVPDDWTIDIAAFRLCGIETAKPGGFRADDYSALAKALGDKLRAGVGA